MFIQILQASGCPNAFIAGNGQSFIALGEDLVGCIRLGWLGWMKDMTMQGAVEKRAPWLFRAYGCFQKIGGKPPKWKVKIMKNPIKIDDLGVTLFLETPI